MPRRNSRKTNGRLLSQSMRIYQRLAGSWPIKFVWPHWWYRKEERKSYNTILDKNGHRSGDRCDENGDVCAARKLLSSPLLNYYLASLYQVHRGRNATVVHWGNEERREGVARALGTTTRDGGNRTAHFCFTFYCPTWIRPIYIKRRTL